MRNEEVSLTVKERRNILNEINKQKASWIGRILRRNCLLRQVIEGKIKGGIEVIGRRERCRKLMDDLKERRGYSHLKEEALDRTMWRARFGRGFGRVVRQTIERMNECFYYHRHQCHLYHHHYKSPSLDTILYQFHAPNILTTYWLLKSILPFCSIPYVQLTEPSHKDL
jgi:hypothetical protein